MGNRHDTQLLFMLTNNLKKSLWMGNYKCVSHKHVVSCFSPCVSVIEGFWKSICSVLVMFMSHGWTLAWPMDSLPLFVWCSLITGRGKGYGETPFMPQSIHFDLTRWCNADQQTGENVKVTVRVRMHVRGTVHVWEWVCVCVCYQCFHYPLLHTCITHIFKIHLKSCFVCFSFEGCICTSVL